MRNIVMALVAGLLVGASLGGPALAGPAPTASVCVELSEISGSGRAAEFMNNNIAAGRVRFVGAADVLCAW